MNMEAAIADGVDTVAIGASAGGVEMLIKLLQELRGTGHTSILIAIHRLRARSELLPEVLSRVCAAPVHEAEDKSPVLPGVVYIAPPDYHLLIDKGPQIALSVDAPVFHCRPSVDVLFESAAREYGRRLLAIVLTGANQDGARGLQAVRKAGGVTAVQDPASAMAPEMPAAALRAGPVDHLLGIEQLQALMRALR
jgi:two-component system, chemotaxis family, protein-glutamate methylesterase/glutaminase